MTNLKITTSEILINGVKLDWGVHRDTIRKNLNLFYKEDERRTEYSRDFIQEICRDFFNDFFLRYDYSSKTLKEIEMHSTFKVEINAKNKIIFSSGDSYSEILPFIKKEFSIKRLAPERHLISDLKMVIASEREMGGDGTGLSYLYIGKDISHLQN